METGCECVWEDGSGESMCMIAKFSLSVAQNDKISKNEQSGTCSISVLFINMEANTRRYRQRCFTGLCPRSRKWDGEARRYLH